MNQKKLVGWALIATLAATLLAVVFEPSIDYETYENITMLIGTAMWIFGVWGVMLLLKK
jgi:hypothetical protein